MTSKEIEIVEIFETQALKYFRELAKRNPNKEKITTLEAKLNDMTGLIKVITPLIKIDNLEQIKSTEDIKEPIAEILKELLNK